MERGDFGYSVIASGVKEEINFSLRIPTYILGKPNNLMHQNNSSSKLLHIYNF